MYQYNHNDRQQLRQRIAQFRDQMERYLAGTLSDEAFLPLRLQNGLYIQRHAPMLRIAVPYGMLSATQLRKLAEIARHYDKGYCHITTRQNIQFNWPRMEDVPQLLQTLSDVEMHSIQTSGNCIRNITSDQFAGVARDELRDPRPYCEIVRQWSTLHPEFAFLPRKFKIAINGAVSDRAATRFHDIGLQLVDNLEGKRGFCVYAGGGLGRTPVVAPCLRTFLPETDLLSYLCAILRVYNRFGRRDNKYKARLKILVREMGVESFADAVEEEWQAIKDHYEPLSVDAIAHAKSFFSVPPYQSLDGAEEHSRLQAQALSNRAFARWLERNVGAHRVAGYATVTLSLKPTGVAPGDITAEQLEAIAAMADTYAFGEARTTHQQNIVLADVRQQDLWDLWQSAKAQGFATPNIGTLTDIICCPGGDYCALANAKSIPVATAIQDVFDTLDYVHDLGRLSLNISGCMNACAHHHIGHIGILGVDKKGEEFYQITLGGHNGSRGRQPGIGKVLGPSLSREEIPAAIERLLEAYVHHRHSDEDFLDTCHRLGMALFKEATYGNHP